MSNPDVIIPMSGIGKRFLDAGYINPKPLINVDGKPMIYHVINLFPGTKNFTFICNENHIKTTEMFNILKDISPNCKIMSISRDNLKGPVDAVSKIFESINDDNEVIVSYCDYGTNWDYYEFLKNVRNSNSDGAIAGYTGFHPHMLGSDNYAFVKHTNGIVEEVQEKKPFTNEKMKEFASNGTYYFKTGKILKLIEQDIVCLVDEENVSTTQIIILTDMYPLSKSILFDNFKLNQFELKQYSPNNIAPNVIQWSNIGIYKGLENDIVILCFEKQKTLIPSNWDIANRYIGTTRARSLLIIYESPDPDIDF